jgi:hypothetical protein
MKDISSFQSWERFIDYAIGYSFIYLIAAVIGIFFILDSIFVKHSISIWVFVIALLIASVVFMVFFLKSKLK